MIKEFILCFLFQPFKGRVGLTKKFKGKLPDQRFFFKIPYKTKQFLYRISSFLGEGKYWEIVPGRGRRDEV